MAARPTIASCVEVISGLITHTNINNRLVEKIDGKTIASFHPSNMEICCKFPRLEVDLTKEWVLELTLDYYQILIQGLMDPIKEF